MMKTLLHTVTLLLICLRAATAIVCMPSLCEGVKQEPLKCAGSVIKGGGFCGCSDVCAKQEGEACGHMDLTISRGTCDDGLTCVPQNNMLFGFGICKSEGKSEIDTRGIYEPTKCEKEKINKQLSNIVYRGMWIPNCEPDGSYSPQQCNNAGKCFCVDKDTGDIDHSTTVVGMAKC